MAIEWDRLGQPEFDRHVEALLYRTFDGALGRVTAVNGRGGDKGIDVQVTTDAGIRIFQLKYHPGGFPGSYRGRRTEIKRSFTRALQHNPVEWTLVVPCTLTPSERAFVDKLADGRTVKVSVMDRPALDDGFAAHPDLEASFTRDQLREAARDYNQEKALLLGGEDLIERVRALGGRADNLDPHWTWDFERRGDLVVRSLRGKHPLAQQASPIRVHLTARPEAISDGLNGAITRTLGFGTAEEVDLPPEAVASLTIDGPAWLSQTVTHARVIWKPAAVTAHAGDPVEVAFLDHDSKTVGRYAGQLITAGSGTLGVSVDTDIHGARLQMMLPFDNEAAGTLRYSFELDGREPGEAIKVLRLHQRLQRGGTVSLSVQGTVAGSGTLPDTSNADAEVERLLQYLSDLDVVQRHCESYFPAPMRYTGAERIDLRVARLLIEGRCVVYRGARTLTVSLNGNDSPALRAVLNEQQPQSLRIGPSAFEVMLGNHTLDIGPVHLFHTRVVADNGREAISALDAGQAAGTKVVFRPHNGEHFRLFHADVPDDGSPLAPTSLGLPGYSDPP